MSFSLGKFKRNESEKWEILVDFTKECENSMPLTKLLASMKTYEQKRKVSFCNALRSDFGTKGK